MIPESVLTVKWTMPGFTYVPGDDGFYHVLFMNIVDVGQVTAIRPAYDLTFKKTPHRVNVYIRQDVVSQHYFLQY